VTPYARLAQIHDFIESKNKKYLEVVGERGLKLSGGEKQRMAVARALIKNSAIMCFDEATSALDNETEAQLSSEISLLSQGKQAAEVPKSEITLKKQTTIIIAHRLTTV